MLTILERVLHTKEIYDHFELNSKNIIKKLKKNYENKNWHQWNG